MPDREATNEAANSEDSGQSDVVRIVILDHDLLIADSLARTLQGDPGIEVLAAVTSVNEVAEFVTSPDPPDVVVIDYRFAEVGGVRSIHSLRDRAPNARIVVLAEPAVGAKLVAALMHAGAVGIVTKDKTVEDLVGAIRAAAAGGTRLSSRPLTSAVSGLPLSPDLGSLTEREGQILQLMAAGLSNSQIALHLDLSTHTVRNHVQRILLKLDAHSKLEAVSVAYRDGLLDPPG